MVRMSDEGLAVDGRSKRVRNFANSLKTAVEFLLVLPCYPCGKNVDFSRCLFVVVLPLFPTACKFHAAIPRRMQPTTALAHAGSSSPTNVCASRRHLPTCVRTFLESRASALNCARTLKKPASRREREKRSRRKRRPLRSLFLPTPRPHWPQHTHAVSFRVVGHRKVN
jgi:hypothetical protein